MDEVESVLVRVGGSKSKGRVISFGFVDLVLVKGDDGLDLSVIIEVERNGCVLYILNVELLGFVIIWFWSIRKREGLKMVFRFLI